MKTTKNVFKLKDNDHLSAYKAAHNTATQNGAVNKNAGEIKSFPIDL